MMEVRVQRAVELFKQGYNCSQSVCAAFADIYGYTEEDAFRMSASFGGGIGRMRMTCGAACGMFILAGLATGSVDGKDKAGKEANYKVVQQLADEFIRRNGALTCADLLELAKKQKKEAGDSEFRDKKSCAKTVESAARIWGEYIDTQQKGDK